MPKLDQFHIVEQFPQFGGDFCVCRPVIAVNFYFAKDTSEIGPALANAIEHYLALIPRDELKCAKLANGDDGPLSSRILQRDLKKLRGSNTSLFEIRYHSGKPANIGPFGIVIISDCLEPDLPTFTNILRFEFSPEMENESGYPTLVRFMADIAAILPFQSGFAGYALAYLDGFQNRAYDFLPGILTRYIGIDPGYTTSYSFMRGATPDAHWITLLSDGILESLGGRNALAKACPKTEIVKMPNGVLIRAAKEPPIGDVNRGAKDIGRMPDIAKFMQSSRVRIPHMFNDDFNSEQWLSRFDERTSTEWDNGE
jgi:Protein of unknown function (DUF3396)